MLPKLFHKILARYIVGMVFMIQLHHRCLIAKRLLIEHQWYRRTHIYDKYIASIDNAVHHNRPLTMSLPDLRNAFGSILHDLINDMLHHICLPTEYTSYISHSLVNTWLWSSVRVGKHHLFLLKEEGDALFPLNFSSLSNL